MVLVEFLESIQIGVDLPNKDPYASILSNLGLEEWMGFDEWRAV